MSEPMPRTLATGATLRFLQPNDNNMLDGDVAVRIERDADGFVLDIGNPDPAQRVFKADATCVNPFLTLTHGSGNNSGRLEASLIIDSNFSDGQYVVNYHDMRTSAHVIFGMDLIAVWNGSASAVKPLGTSDLSALAKTSDLSALAKTSDLAGLPQLADVVKPADLAGLAHTSDLGDLAHTADLAGLAKTTDLSDLAHTADLAGLAKTTDLAGLPKPPTPTDNAVRLLQVNVPAHKNDPVGSFGWWLNDVSAKLTDIQSRLTALGH